MSNITINLINLDILIRSASQSSPSLPSIKIKIIQFFFIKVKD